MKYVRKTPSPTRSSPPACYLVFLGLPLAAAVVSRQALVVSIAVAAMQDGERVFVLETDEQGTMSKWGLRRTNPEPGIDRVSSGPALDRALGLLAGDGYTVAIIDTPGTASVGTTAAIRVADLCLLPVRPSPADIEAAEPTLSAIRRVGKPFAFVLNQAPARSFRLGEAAAALNMMGALAPTYIVARTDHQDALGAGLGVTEFAPEGKAAEEVRSLWSWIRKKLTRGIGISVRLPLIAATRIRPPDIVPQRQQKQQSMQAEHRFRPHYPRTGPHSRTTHGRPSTRTRAFSGPG